MVRKFRGSGKLLLRLAVLFGVFALIFLSESIVIEGDSEEGLLNFINLKVALPKKGIISGFISAENPIEYCRRVYCKPEFDSCISQAQTDQEKGSCYTLFHETYSGSYCGKLCSEYYAYSADCLERNKLMPQFNRLNGQCLNLTGTNFTNCILNQGKEIKKIYNEYCLQLSPTPSPTLPPIPTIPPTTITTTPPPTTIPPTTRLKVYIEADKESYSVGEIIFVRVIVKDSNGYPVHNVYLAIKYTHLESGKVFYNSGHTDSDGQYSWNWTWDETQVGSWLIEVTASKSGYEDSYDSETVIVNPSRPSLGLIVNIDTDKETYFVNETIFCKITVRDTTDNPMPGISLNIKYSHLESGKVFNDSGITDSNGQYSWNWTWDETQVGSWQLDISASKEGYESDSDSVTVFVEPLEKLNVKIATNAEKYYVGDRGLIIIEVTDQKGIGVSLASVRITITHVESGNKYEDSRMTLEGLVTYEYTWDKAGKWKIEVEGSKEGYLSDKKEKELDVLLKPTYTLNIFTHDEKNQPKGGITIKLFYPDGKVEEVTSDSQGKIFKRYDKQLNINVVFRDESEKYLSSGKKVTLSADVDILITSIEDYTKLLQNKVSEFLKKGGFSQEEIDKILKAKIDFKSNENTPVYDPQSKTIKINAGIYNKVDDLDQFEKALIHEFGHFLLDNIADPSGYYIKGYPLQGKWVGGKHNTWVPAEDESKQLAFEEAYAEFFSQLFFKSQNKVYDADFETATKSQDASDRFIQLGNVIEGNIASFLYGYYKGHLDNPQEVYKDFSDTIKAYESYWKSFRPARTIEEFLDVKLNSKSGLKYSGDLRKLAETYRIKASNVWEVVFGSEEAMKKVKIKTKSGEIKEFKPSMYLDKGDVIEVPDGVRIAFQKFPDGWVFNGEKKWVYLGPGRHLVTIPDNYDTIQIDYGKAQFIDTPAITPDGTIIKPNGTNFILEVDENKNTKVTVLSGEVFVENKETRQKETILANQTLIIIPEKPFGKPEKAVLPKDQWWKVPEENSFDNEEISNVYYLLLIFIVLLFSIILFIITRKAVSDSRSRKKKPQVIEEKDMPEVIEEYRACEKCGRKISVGSVYCPYCKDKQRAGEIALCEECGRPIPEDSTFCSYCGDKQGTEKKAFCEECGKEIPIESKYCSKCGDKQGVP